MMKLFKRILDFFNIHPDKNQRWTLSTVFVVGLLYTYVQPAITKAWVSELPAEWIAFQSLAYSICGLLIGMIWKDGFAARLFSGLPSSASLSRRQASL